MWCLRTLCLITITSVLTVIVKHVETHVIIVKLKVTSIIIKHHILKHHIPELRNIRDFPL